ncbi:MAG TPA: hypothetical protein VGB17_08870, partial [Pyrinomonadaceae bacterium]
MSLVTPLGRHLGDPALSRDQRAALCCQTASELEERGDYQEAQSALAEFWPRVGEPPNLQGLDQSTAAEMLLRVG